MATITVDARATFNQSDDIVALELEYQGRSATMTARRDWTLDDLAREILAQSFPPEPDRSFQQRLTIDATSTGGIWTVNNVTAEALPDEAARDGFANLPGWATWTADGAAAWIDANVVDLASAKVALAAMARAIVYLREWRR